MSSLTLFKDGALAVPDYLRQTDDLTKMLAGGGDGHQISIKGGVWRMIVGGEEVAKNEDRAMNLVVVNASPKVQRTYYAGKYEEGVVAQPACWSADGTTPNPEVPKDQRQANTCATCPQNIAGSGEGASRACRYSRRLAVVLENDISGAVYRLQLPAKSIFGKPEGDKMPLDAYAKFLSGHNVPLTGVVTEARFDTNEAVPVLRFRAVRPLRPDEWEAAKAAAATEDAARAIKLEVPVKPKDGATPAPAAPPTPAPAAPAPTAAAPAVVPEPTVRPSKPTPVAPVTSQEAADIMAQWASDDDA